MADAAQGNKGSIAAGSGYNLLGPGDAFGAAAFFTETSQLEHCRWVAGCWLADTPPSACVCTRTRRPAAPASLVQAPLPPPAALTRSPASSPPTAGV
jgi:hypothetical protein